MSLLKEHSLKKSSTRTSFVHGGRGDLADLGVHALPLDLSTSYPLADLAAGTASLEALATGGTPQGSPVYARLHNPTVGRFEKAMAGLEASEEAVAFSSGMAALTAVLLAARERGDHVVAIRPIYGGSDHLLSSDLLNFDVTWCLAEDVPRAKRPSTALVIVETPANPTLALTDIEALMRQAGNVPVLVDSTFATPYLQQPCELGAALVLHSATKFLGGHGDVVGGVVATNAEWAAALRRVRVATGGLLHPLAAYLLHRGLPTLPVRVEAAQRSASELARRLVCHSAVDRVDYPGLPGCDPLGLVGRQMHGPGSLLAFELAGGYRAAARVLERVELITPAVSLGSVDSLIQHPAGLTHHVVDPAARRQCGVGDGLLRLSVGLEDVEDLWHDLADALAHADRAGPSRAGQVSVCASRTMVDRRSPALP